MRIDANLAYIVGSLLGLSPDERVDALESYRGAWRRGEKVGYTEHGNLVMSDYGHHPSEIRPTLAALRSSIGNQKFIVVFQPHQYSRTRELLFDFADVFGAADRLIIPDIYFSRDKSEDVAWMTVDRLIEVIRPHQPNVQNGQGLDATYHILQNLDQESPGGIVFLLLGAGNVDDLRYRLVPSLLLSR